MYPRIGFFFGKMTYPCHSDTDTRICIRAAYWASGDGISDVAPYL